MGVAWTGNPTLDDEVGVVVYFASRKDTQPLSAIADHLGFLRISDGDAPWVSDVALSWGWQRFELSAGGRPLWSGAAVRGKGVASPRDGGDAMVLIVDDPALGGFHKFPRLELTKIWAARVLMSVSRASQGRLAGLVHSSDAQARALFELQETLEGPTVSAAADGVPFLAENLAAYDEGPRWLMFGREATVLGVRAVFAFPLTIGAVRLGVLTLHGEEPVVVSLDTLAAMLRVLDTLSVALLALEASRRPAW